MAPPSTDATLSDLRVNDVTVPGFAADKYEYTIDVPYGTAVGSDLVQVTAEKNDPKATMNINQATALPGAATVVVTAEDGIASNTYTVNFNVLPNTDASLNSLDGKRRSTELCAWYLKLQCYSTA
ncbi:MAG: cadherin-like beta sandwich domain-containing protein [Peptococcia bacterium]